MLSIGSLRIHLYRVLKDWDLGRFILNVANRDVKVVVMSADRALDYAVHIDVSIDVDGVGLLQERLTHR